MQAGPMSAQPHPARWTLADYLAFEAKAPVRHELVAGQVFALAGASVNHNLIAGQTYAAPLPRVRAQGCQIFMEAVKLHLRQWDCQDLVLRLADSYAGLSLRTSE